MVSFNVYRSTSSGAYVEGVCLATDEKPVVGIANGSILFAVDTESGETTRYMYDQNSMSWIEAADPSGSGGSGGSGGDSGDGGDSSVFSFIVDYNDGDPTSDTSFSDVAAAAEAGKSVVATLIKYSEGRELDAVQLPLVVIQRSDRSARAEFSAVRCYRTTQSESDHHDFSYYNLTLDSDDFLYREETFTLSTPSV